MFLCMRCLSNHVCLSIHFPQYSCLLTAITLEKHIGNKNSISHILMNINYWTEKCPLWCSVVWNIPFGNFGSLVPNQLWCLTVFFGHLFNGRAQDKGAKKSFTVDYRSFSNIKVTGSITLLSVFPQDHEVHLIAPMGASQQVQWACAVVCH